MRAIHLGLVSAFVLCALTARAHAVETCGDGQDNDADGMTDEGCFGQVCESPLSCGDAGLISPKSGSSRYALPPDLSPRVPFGPGISFARTYLSAFSPVTSGMPQKREPMGPHWSHTYATWLDRLTAPNPDQIILHLNNGRDVLFTYSTTNGGWEYFVPQVGYHAIHLRRQTSAPNNYELKTLTGEVLVYDSQGRLAEVCDTLATPNKVLVGHGTHGPTTVTDAAGKRRLQLVYNAGGRITTVNFQINTGSWTTQVSATYTYSSTKLATVTIGGQLAQQMTYNGNNQLTLLEDGAGNDVVACSYASASPTQVVRAATSDGTVGYEYASARAACSGQTVAYFNQGNATACDDDADCGAGFLCGGETNPAASNTGVCFRAARCMTVTSPGEDLVTSVVPLGPPSESCEGSCTDVAQYDWNTSGVLDLKAVKDPANNYTTYAFNSNGLPTTIVYGDPDNDATNGNGARTMWLYYGNASFPGRVTEIRRKSDISTSTCSSSVTTGCARTLYTFDSNGLLSQVQQLGFTLDASAATTAYTYTTTNTFDTSGRLTQIDGPLAGSNDVTVFEYWSSTNALLDKMLQRVKRKKDSTNFITTEIAGYSFWGLPTEIQDPDGTWTCRTFSAARGYLATNREAMNGQTSCATTHASDITTQWTRDSWLRLTRIDKPDGSCLFHEYDSRGRLWKTKPRDDCNAASSGDTVERTYNTDGLLTKTERIAAGGASPSWREEQTYFDSRRLATIINPVVPTKWTSLTYDPRGLIDIVEAPDTLSKDQYVHNADDRLETVKRYRDTTNFDAWDLVNNWLGQLASVTDDDTKQIQVVNDDLGRRVKVITPDSGTTLRVYNADGTIATMKEAFGTAGVKTHAFTWDNLRRPLTANYDGDCGNGPLTESSWIYDAPPESCPILENPGACTRTNGRLAYVKTSLLCTTTGDKSLDQETFYGYADDGKLVREWIRDDTTRTADHIFSWTKNGQLAQVETPASATLTWSRGSAGSNSDTSLATSMSRSATTIADQIAWNPFGPLKSYRHMSTWGVGSNNLQTVITRNLAYRVTNMRVESTSGVLYLQTAITEDNKGRVTTRDISGAGSASVKDSYFQYDKLDRLVCVMDGPGACDTTKAPMVHDASPPYTASNDWKNFKRPIPGSTGRNHVVTLQSGKDQLASVAQNDGSPTLGTTSYSFDLRGNRISDDNTTSLNFDERTYTYDGRRNLQTVSGKFYDSSTWHNYVMTSAYDARNRRVFKSFKDTTSGTEAQWFFYYDPLDRLTEIHHTFDISDDTQYRIIQIAWLDDRPVYRHQIYYPSTSTERLYFHTDESTRPIDMSEWLGSGGASRVWYINPDAWGNDTDVSLYGDQWLVFPGQFRDDETVAWQNSGGTAHRPALIYNWYRTYDPITGSYLQTDRAADKTWDLYIYAKSNPVGVTDRWGLMDSDEEMSCEDMCWYIPDPGCMDACNAQVGCGGVGCDGQGDNYLPGGSPEGGDLAEWQSCGTDNWYESEWCGVPDPEELHENEHQDAPPGRYSSWAPWQDPGGAIIRVERPGTHCQHCISEHGCETKGFYIDLGGGIVIWHSQTADCIKDNCWGVCPR